MNIYDFFHKSEIQHYEDLLDRFENEFRPRYKHMIIFVDCFKNRCLYNYHCNHNFYDGDTLWI